MVVKGTVIVTFVELMQAQGEATPDNPALQVSLFVIEDQVVGPAKWPASKGENVFLKNHPMPILSAL